MRRSISEIRDEVPMLGHTVYFNNARISPPPAIANRAVRDILDDERNLGWHRMDSEKLIWDTRASIARLIGAGADEIAITQSATYSVNVIAGGLSWPRGGNIVMTDLDYRSVAESFIRAAEDEGLEIRVVPSEGLFLDPAAFEPFLDERTRIVVVPYVPTFCGVVQPVEEIGRVVRKTGALYAVNATQAVGRFPIDVDRIGCDFLFGTSRKWLRGPRGLGFLYVRKAIIPELRPPYMGARCAEWVGPTEYRLAQDIERLQTGDYPYVLLAGLEAAASFAHDVGLEWIGERSAHLGALARERFSEIRGVTVYDIVHGSLATVPVNVAGISGDQVVREMGMRGIVCCTIVEENCLLALRSLGLSELVRISIHYYNTEDEIDKAAVAVEELAAVRG